MSDILTRLSRWRPGDDRMVDVLIADAADEIKRLLGDISVDRLRLRAAQNEIDSLNLEAARLRLAGRRARLSGEERAALATAIEAYDLDNDDEACLRLADVFRGLLSRLSAAADVA